MKPWLVMSDTCDVVNANKKTGSTNKMQLTPDKLKGKKGRGIMNTDY
jgi:hypothetical protein